MVLCLAPADALYLQNLVSTIWGRHNPAILGPAPPGLMDRLSIEASQGNALAALLLAVIRTGRAPSGSITIRRSARLDYLDLFFEFLEPAEREVDSD